MNYFQRGNISTPLYETYKLKYLARFYHVQAKLTKCNNRKTVMEKEVKEDRELLTVFQHGMESCQRIDTKIVGNMKNLQSPLPFGKYMMMMSATCDVTCLEFYLIQISNFLQMMFQMNLPAL